MDTAFYHPHGDGFAATDSTRGPWDNRFQHGGPPAALLAGTMARLGEDSADFAVARFTMELLRPVPIATVHVLADFEGAGRTVQRLRAELLVEGRTVALARALRIRRKQVEPPPAAAAPTWPDPDSLEPITFDFFQHEIGYHRAVDIRMAYGTWGATPVGVWARPRMALVAGRDTLPLERLVTLADAQSGMGPPLDPMLYTFINPDMSAYLARVPEGEWFGFDISSTVGPDGAGLSESALRDRAGPLGRAAQSLVVERR